MKCVCKFNEKYWFGEDKLPPFCKQNITKLAGLQTILYICAFYSTAIGDERTDIDDERTDAADERTSVGDGGRS